VSEPRNAISARDSHIWTLRMALVIVGCIALALAGILYTRQNDFFLHVPPDLSHGANIKPGELQAPNAYAFASFIWRGLNDWPLTGKTDYPTNIKKLECYVSPAFLQWIQKNAKEKNDSGELSRTRSLSLDDAFTSDMVDPIGNNVFDVALTAKVHERIEGLAIKDIIVRYPLRVVADTRSCNLMGMALDGFYAQPERTEHEQVLVEKK
jgi:integrating conjugative element protein (TIGR03746 family)